jgi:uncharacterized protein (DUF342 family)
MTAADLHAYLVANGYGDCAIASEILDTVANDCNTRTTPFVIPIAQRQDANIAVAIAPDGMAATVSVIAPQGGKSASLEDIVRALNDAGVLYGIDHEALLKACESPGTEALPVAFGVPPQDGVDTGFEELTVGTSDRAPKLDANGLIDYREHSGIAIVEKGVALMRRIPPTPGVPGQSIRGELLPPRPGRDEPFASNLAGAQADEQDPNLLTASIAGQPVRVPCGVMVEPVLRVEEVNLATGNIYFDGTVEVVGDVNATMKVQATGDIVVGGTVEGSILDCGGNVRVKGGIIATARVSAKGSISARFVEGARLHAGTVIALDDMALESHLQAGNQILIGVKAPQRGRLIGGSAQALMQLQVPYLGSSKSGLTQIVVGSNPELEAAYQALQERIATEKTNEENLQKLVQHLTKTGDPKGMLDKVRAAWRQAVQVWGKSLAQRGELDKQLQSTRNARLDIGIATSGMVDIAFGTRKLRLRKEYGRGAFSLDTSSRIVFTDPSGQASPAS